MHTIPTILRTPTSCKSVVNYQRRRDTPHGDAASCRVRWKRIWTHRDGASPCVAPSTRHPIDSKTTDQRRRAALTLAQSEPRASVSEATSACVCGQRKPCGIVTSTLKKHLSALFVVCRHLPLGIRCQPLHALPTCGKSTHNLQIVGVITLKPTKAELARNVARQREAFIYFIHL